MCARDLATIVDPRAINFSQKLNRKVTAHVGTSIGRVASTRESDPTTSVTEGSPDSSDLFCLVPSPTHTIHQPRASDWEGSSTVKCRSCSLHPPLGPGIVTSPLDKG